MNKLIKKYNKAESKYKDTLTNFHNVYGSRASWYVTGSKTAYTEKDVNRARKRTDKAFDKANKLAQSLRNYQTGLEGKFKLAKENYDKAQAEYFNSSIRGPKLTHNLMKADNKLIKIRKEIKATRTALKGSTEDEY